MTWRLILFALAISIAVGGAFGLLVYVALAGDVPESWDDGGYEDWEKRPSGGWR